MPSVATGDYVLQMENEPASSRPPSGHPISLRGALVLGALFLLSLIAVAFMRGGAWRPDRE